MRQNNTNIKPMKNLLLSAAIGDICGVPYEFIAWKDYDNINLFHPKNDYSDDSVCTFACAEAFLEGKDIAERLKNRCLADPNRCYGLGFRNWLSKPGIAPAYNSWGNGSAMRASSAGFLAKSEDECVDLATKTALPTHNHPEGIKGAVATALAIFYAMHGHDKEYIRTNVLNKFYPKWEGVKYKSFQPSYQFNETCMDTVPASIICFLESTDFEDCLKKTIATGGDADTMAAISCPIAYAFYKEMPEKLIELAKIKLPKWMLDVNDKFDDVCNM